ncbi:MAG: sugar lactone lactonase YvrE [Gammaproteobacteria bacterium]|jgi:sugar lactone lactonase YvrE
MKSILKLLAVLIIVVVVYFSAWPISVDPVVEFVPQDPPEMTGVYAPNQALQKSKMFGGPIGHGPEASAIDQNGIVYTGLNNGDIVAITPDGKLAVKLVNTGGRPLGMVIHEGDLFVADAKKGLLRVTTGTREITVLTDSVNGEKIPFVDDLDVTADGMVYFSDASAYGFADHLLDLWDGRPTGRLLSYNIETQETKVVVEGLFFANGVAIGPSDEYLLVNETWAYRTQRYWLKGDKAGQMEIFADNLPGMPDNVTFNGTDTFWFGLPAGRDAALQTLQKSASARNIYLRIPESLRPAPPTGAGLVLGLDLDGKPTHLLQDPSGEFCHTITGAKQRGDHLLITTLVGDSVRIVDIQ